MSPKSFTFLKKKVRGSSTDKKYYILNPSFEIIPIRRYRFNKTEIHLQSLADNEYLDRNPKSKGKNVKLEAIIHDMGFEWEPLSEPGQMRQMPYATTIMEAIEKYSWLVAEQFSNEQGFPIHR